MRAKSNFQKQNVGYFGKHMHFTGTTCATDSPQEGRHTSNIFDLGDSFRTVVSSLLKKLIKLFTEDFQGTGKTSN